MASRKIGALWVRKSKEGKTFLSGVLEDLRGTIQIAVFKNDRKEKENQPDYQIILSEQQEKKAEAHDDFLGEAETLPATTQDNEDEINVENIPFD